MYRNLLLVTILMTVSVGGSFGTGNPVEEYQAFFKQLYQTDVSISPTTPNCDPENLCVHVRITNARRTQIQSQPARGQTPLSDADTRFVRRLSDPYFQSGQLAQGRQAIVASLEKVLHRRQKGIDRHFPAKTAGGLLLLLGVGSLLLGLRRMK